MGGDETFKNRVSPYLQSYFGSCFERMCREALAERYKKEGLVTSFKIGEYWDRDIQVDVVGYRNDLWTDLVECKWGEINSKKSVEAELRRKSSIYPNARGATIVERIFTSEPKKVRDRGGVHWYGLKDLYE